MLIALGWTCQIDRGGKYFVLDTDDLTIERVSGGRLIMSGGMVSNVARGWINPCELGTVACKGRVYVFSAGGDSCMMVEGNRMYKFAQWVELMGRGWKNVVFVDDVGGEIVRLEMAEFNDEYVRMLLPCIEGVGLFTGKGVVPFPMGKARYIEMSDGEASLFYKTLVLGGRG